MAFIKPITEKGFVLSKTYKEAKEQRTDFNGRVWPAKDEEFVLEVISCGEGDFSEQTGIANGTKADYKVDKATFDKVKFGDWGVVKYVATQYGEKLSIKTESFILKKGV